MRQSQIRLITRIDWILKALINVYKLKIPFIELVLFFLTRFSSNPKSITIRKFEFFEVDKTLWSHLFHIIFLQEYLPSGYSICENDVVIDIGANRGVFIALALIKGAGRILAYEPDDNNYEYLQKFVEKNNLKQVELFRYAVAGKNGTIKLFKSSKNTRHTILGMDISTGKSLVKYQEVPSICLNDILEGLDRVDFLKMDCEGAEFEIFKSVEGEAIKKVSSIVMEYHGNSNSQDVINLVNKLTRLGFVVEKNENPMGVPYGMIFAHVG